MARQTPHQGRGSSRSIGVVSGYVLKLVRESVDLTQIGLAEELVVDFTTVQGWESGRRPLAALRARDLSRLRQRMVGLGASPRMFTVLNDAIEADLVLAEAIESGPENVETRRHSLATTIHRRGLTNLITWPITGITPTSLDRTATSKVSARRGPVPDRPTLTVSEKERFFGHLRDVADRCANEADDLLRRQANYLVGFDENTTSKDWLRDRHAGTLRSSSRASEISHWLPLRSSAIALAQGGDHEPLRYFVEVGLRDQQQRIANLNYWAYWIGEIDEVLSDDRHMLGLSADRWTGNRLLAHLLMRLTPNSAYSDLNIHSLWTLLMFRPSLFAHRPDLRSYAKSRIESVLDASNLSKGARQELASLSYAIEIADR